MITVVCSSRSHDVRFCCTDWYARNVVSLVVGFACFQVLLNVVL